jgi:hypothetical protein
LGSAQLMPAWDTSCTVAGLIIFCLFTASLLGAGKNMAFSFFAGGIAGLLILLNPSSLMVLLPWVAYLAVRNKLRLKEIVCLLAILSLIVFAWAARNRLQLGAFVVRTNLGMTLYASNNDCAEPSMIADQLHNCYQSHHPNTSLPEARLLSTLGEAKYNRRRTADVMNWIKTHPSRFWLLTLARCREFWFPPLRPHPFSTCVIWTATALSIPGLLLMIYRFHPATLYVLAVLFIYPPIYYVVVSDVRYRYPVLWLSLLPAGYCVCQLLSNQLERIRLGPPIRDEHVY